MQVRDATTWSDLDNDEIDARSYQEVQVWDASIGTHLLSYKGHSGSVRTVAWSPDGRHIASGSSEKTVQIWDANTGANVYTYHGHSSPVNAVAWSPDGRHIASAGYGVHVWQAV